MVRLIHLTRKQTIVNQSGIMADALEMHQISRFRGYACLLHQNYSYTPCQMFQSQSEIFTDYGEPLMHLMPLSTRFTFCFCWGVVKSSFLCIVACSHAQNNSLSFSFGIFFYQGFAKCFDV